MQKFCCAKIIDTIVNIIAIGVGILVFSTAAIFAWAIIQSVLN